MSSSLVCTGSCTRWALVLIQWGSYIPACLGVALTNDDWKPRPFTKAPPTQPLLRVAALRGLF